MLSKLYMDGLWKTAKEETVTALVLGVRLPLDVEAASVKDNGETVNHANGDNVPVSTKK
jgi:hypothetical protein